MSEPGRSVADLKSLFEQGYVQLAFSLAIIDLEHAERALGEKDERLNEYATKMFEAGQAYGDLCTRLAEAERERDALKVGAPVVEAVEEKDAKYWWDECQRLRAQLGVLHAARKDP